MKKGIVFILRILFTIASLGFLALFVGPMITNRIINIGNISGAVLCVWVLCVAVKPIHMAIKNAFSKFKLTRFIFRFVNACFILFAVYGCVVTSAMIYFAVQAPVEGSTAVVLGAQVKQSGPSQILRERINAAEKFLNENENSVAVLSGGQGYDEPTSEAQCMYDTMVADGISADRLYMESNSTNTKENLEYSMQVIESNNLSTDLTIITDGFHQLRANLIAVQLDIEGDIGAQSADTFFYYVPTYAVREWFAIPNQLLFR